MLGHAMPLTGPGARPGPPVPQRSARGRCRSAAAVASWPLSSCEPVEAGAVERLLLGVAGEHAEADRHAGVDATWVRPSVAAEQT